MLKNADFRLKIASIPQNIELIEPFLEKGKNSYLLKDEVYFNILVVLTEAVNNSILHGNQSNPNKNVWVKCKLEKKILLFNITDEGSGFNPKIVPDPTAIEHRTQPNGRGLFLMRQLSDKLTYYNQGRSVGIQFKVTWQKMTTFC